MLWVIASLVVYTCIIVLGAYLFSAPRYHGPVSDHFDGKVFANIGGAKAKGWKDLLKWFRTRDRQAWQFDSTATYGTLPQQFDTGICITFVNHSTFLIQIDGLNVLTDPIWSDRTSPVSFAGPKRMRPPGICFDDLPQIDLVLISHNHYDHLDVATVKRLIKVHNPKFITPLGVGQMMRGLGSERVEDMDWWDEVAIHNTIKVACVPAQHFSGRGGFDRDATLWCGFVLLSNQGNVYFAGDTGFGAFFKEIGQQYKPIKVAILPIGAYIPRWFMSPIHVSPEEAVAAHQDLQSEMSIAMHFGTFPLADDGQQQPVADLHDALYEAQVPPKQFVVLKEGDSIAIE
jgi:L-ascorbate metabolism protein UlaG (beta-lactamase superfamily)